MDNDLISREELKVHISELMLVYSAKELNNAILNAIDNAPTVNAIPNEEGYEMYSKGYLQGYERGNSEIPQGEWVVTKLLHSEDVTCPFCNARPTKSEYGYYLRDNFCHECGARMKGGAE